MISSREAALAAWLGHQIGVDDLRVTAWSKLPGGAIQANFALDVEVARGALAGRQRFVLRTDARSTVAASLDRRQEYAVLRAVHAAGIPVPEPLFLCEDSDVLGTIFFVMRRLPGVAAGRQVVRDPAMVRDRAALAHELGACLARIHGLTPPLPGSEALPAPHHDHARGAIAEYRRFLDAMDEAHPALEWGLRWCERNAPEPTRPTLIHRDYRTGNYLVDGGRLAGILDWEFAGYGDPREDLGWFSARCWRFGAVDREAGGLAPLEPFLDGYASQGGIRVSREELHYWQLMAHLRWAVIALQQSRRHLVGGERSLELALTGRIVHELEHEIVRMTAAPRRHAKAGNAPGTGSGGRNRDRAHAASIRAPRGDIATGDELLATAVETLTTALLPRLTGGDRYAALMVARAASIAMRERQQGPVASEAERAGVARLLEDEPAPTDPSLSAARHALAVAIRSGRFDSGAREEALVAHLAESAVNSVAISNPGATG